MLIWYNVEGVVIVIEFTVVPRVSASVVPRLFLHNTLSLLLLLSFLLYCILLPLSLIAQGLFAPFVEENAFLIEQSPSFVSVFIRAPLAIVL